MISLLVFGGIGTGGVLSLIGWCWRKAKREDAVASDRKLLRKINAGTYRIPPEKAPHVMREIFRPMGARLREDATSLSTAADVARLRAWRERRAVTSRDHTTQHFAEGELPSEWAQEVLHLCVGDRETMGDGTE